MPADHLLRAIDRFVDLSAIRQHLAPLYSLIGRPSIDPELLICMLIVGYCFGIRSERRLAQQLVNKHPDRYLLSAAPSARVGTNLPGLSPKWAWKYGGRYSPRARPDFR